MAQNPWVPWLSAWGASDQAAGQHEPLSGDVSQWLRIFSPTVTVNGRGDPDLEGEIVRDVATYGAQLGPLTTLVLALVDGQPPPEEARTKLRDICQAIQLKKNAYAAGALDRARGSLTELRHSDPAGLATLLAEFAENGPE
jgi:hypothetical protein